MKEGEGVGHDGVGQDVIPAVSEFPENMPGLRAVAGLAGGQESGITLTAGRRNQSENSGPEPVTAQQAAQPLEFAVT